MRIKGMVKVLALVLSIGAFLTPMSVRAGGDNTPPTLTAALEGGTLIIESKDEGSGVEAVYIEEMRVNSLVDGKASVAFKDYAGNRESVNLYAVDYAGNRSDAVTVDNPYYEAPAFVADDPVEGDAVTTPDNDETAGIPFTPDGTGEVVDMADGTKDNKQFYTITTEEGNIFYLIIDGERESDNVYFLNAVTEADLMALAEKGEDAQEDVIPAPVHCSCTEKCEIGQVNADCAICKNDLTGCTGKEVQTVEAEEPEPEPEKKSGGIGTLIFVVIGMAVVGGVGYYVKILRPRQLAEEDEDEDDEDGYGEGFDPDEDFGGDEYLPEDDDIDEDDDEE